MYQGLGVSGSLSQLKQDQKARERAVDKVRRKQQARALRVLHSPRPTREFHPVCPDTQKTADLAGDIYREYGAAMDDALGNPGFLPGVPAWQKWGALVGFALALGVVWKRAPEPKNAPVYKITRRKR